jgi:hypothetical protein
MTFENNVFYDHLTYLYIHPIYKKNHGGLELSRFCFCRLNILEVTGKAQTNAEENNPGLYNVPQVSTGHWKNEFEICYFGICIVHYLLNNC